MRWALIEAKHRTTFEAVLAKGWGCWPLWLERRSLESAKRTLKEFNELDLLIVDLEAGKIL